MVGNSASPKEEWHASVIASVEKITHICVGDSTGAIIEEPLTSHGCILVPANDLGLCASVTKALYSTTTEVYPDSPKTNDEECNRAQRAAVEGALNYIRDFHSL